MYTALCSTLFYLILSYSIALNNISAQPRTPLYLSSLLFSPLLPSFSFPSLPFSSLPLTPLTDRALMRLISNIRGKLTAIERPVSRVACC